MTARICDPFSLADQMISLAEQRMDAAGIPKIESVRTVRCPACCGDGYVHGVGTDAQGYERYEVCKRCEGSGSALTNGEPA